ncbi:MAG: aminotransferase class I/II-fold pyridoxal phosphate-dependent enzyme, partial [Opitutae bacterium]
MIPYSKQNITDEDLRAVSAVLQSDFLTQGPGVEAFEDSLKDYFAVKHAIACSSGTAALHLSYASIGVCPQTIGIVPAVTFSATANAFRYLGAEVRFCDVDQQTGLLCLDSLTSLLENIKPAPCQCPILIAPVSFAGATAPLDELDGIAAKFGFRVIEDASHSPGSTAQSKNGAYNSGSCIYSDAACLSFHPVKHICCGEGGAVLTNDHKLAKLARKLRSHGIERPFDDSHQSPWFYEQTELGWNYRLTDFQAVLGQSQLSRLDAQLEKRRQLAANYVRSFSNSPFKECFECPALLPGHSWHLFIIRFKQTGIRDKAHKYLKSRGITTQVHYVPLYRHPYYRERYGEAQLPGAEEFYQSCLSIPMFPALS